MSPSRTSVVTWARRFRQESGGNVAMIFALTLLPVLLAIGAAYDYGHANSVRTRMQAALDATGLMLAHDIGTQTETELVKQAQNAFKTNFGSEKGVVVSPLEVTIVGDTIELNAEAMVNTAVMQLGGIDHMAIKASSEIVRGQDSYEVVLVLDNTGSMSGSKIKALKEAAELLVNNLFGEASVHPLLKVAVVPFSHAVNVGTGNKNAAWMDTQGLSPIHAELFDADFTKNKLTRFDLYDNIKNVEWPGCVEARPYPLDVNGTAPSTSDPKTLFVPYFHPDEPGGAGSATSGYFNSYLADGGKSKDSNQVKQERTAKYSKGVTAKQSGSSSQGLGPAYGCTSNPIVPLTDTKKTVADALQNMQANGYTNITEGLMWGFRVISPDAPFTEGKAYDTEDHHKVIVLLTDGKNEVASTGSSNHNKSMYGPYGYTGLKNDTLGYRLVNSNSSSTITSKMNERTAEACTFVKSKGIELFTITFQVGDTNTENLMRDCATKPDMYYNSPDTGTLKKIFKSIATRISRLRIAR